MTKIRIAILQSVSECQGYDRKVNSPISPILGVKSVIYDQRPIPYGENLVNIGLEDPEIA